VNGMNLSSVEDGEIKLTRDPYSSNYNGRIAEAAKRMFSSFGDGGSSE
jgi:hypothetical protein